MRNIANSLLSTVKNSLLDEMPQLGFAVLEHEDSDSFGNAHVILQSADLRLRVLCDRGIVFVDFGSIAEPGSWYDSAVVFEWLDLSQNGGIHGPSATQVVESLAALLRICGAEIHERFSRTRFHESKLQLEAIRNARAAQRYGFTDE